jgi:hypothetical protein
MKRWLTSLFFLISLVASVPAGTPFAENSGMNENVCPMKCCKKKTAKSAEPKRNDVKICRTLNCSTPTPTNTNSSSQINFTPNLILSEKATLFEILFSTPPKENVQPFYKNQTRLTTFQPKYIQHQSFLI